MAKDQGNIDLNSDEDSDFEGFNSDEIGSQLYQIQSQALQTLKFLVSSVGYSDLSDLGEEEDENAEIDDGGGVGEVNPIWTTNFTLFLKKVVLHCLITLMLLLQVHWITLTCYSNMKLLKTSKSTQTAMDYLREEIQQEQNNPNYTDALWEETTVPELKALYSINIIMGISDLPQFTFYWHQNDSIGNTGIKKTMSRARFERLTL